MCFDCSFNILRDPECSAVAVVTLGHGGGLGARAADVCDALIGSVEDLMHGDATCRAIVISVAGAAGCAAEHGGGADVWTQERRRAHVRWTIGVLALLADAPKPVLVAIESDATDDLLAWAALATEVIAASGVRFQALSLRQGGWPAFALQSGLAWRVGGARARWVLMTGRVVDAGEACELGIVDHLVEPGEAKHVACLRARQYVACAPLPVASMGRLLVGRSTTLDEAIAAELDVQPALRDSNDHAEAVAAFVAKRSPVFAGN